MIPRARPLLALLALLLCGPVGVAVAQAPEDAALETEDAFRTFMESLWPEANAHGISRRTFDQALAEVRVDWRVLERANFQPEHEFSLGDYLDRLVSAARIEEGRRQLAAHADTFRSIEAKYGVDRHVVAAIWGIESSYGLLTGEHGVIRALGMLAWKGERRAAFGKQQLMAALRIIERGDIAPSRMLGSWAGAMGHTQFIPTTYGNHAVDFDRDGRRDIWGTVADALASTANYLKVSGWRTGVPWGLEVSLPKPFDVSLMDRAQSVEAWAKLGLETATLVAWRPQAGTPPTTTVTTLATPRLASVSATLLLPTGAKGPAFLVTDNFRALLKYNNAKSYALAVGHLADRLAGAGALVQAWPNAADDRALNRLEREDLQRLLADLGLYKGEADGLLGDQTKAALLAWQRQKGLPADAYPSVGVLTHLRGSRSASLP